MAVPSDMPWFLRERTRSLSGSPIRENASCIIYWMRTGLRTGDNPALDVATWMGNRTGLPVLIYQGLSERTPYANDRHHHFILEGARDVAAECERGDRLYALHLERPGHRGAHLKTMLAQAALLVTEDMPVSPLRNWTKKLATEQDTPVWSVDTACVVPMLSVGKAIMRAFQYRKAIAPLVGERLQWDAPVPDKKASLDLDWLPFVPVDISSNDIGELVAQCEIDHTIGPITDTPGGSSAGYARWNKFRDNKLKSYAKTRNGPNRHGVSRMSPYLHYGMVSAHRLAREARAVGGPGADKFEDELIIWRELAYTWCLYSRDHESLDAVPDWAKKTLFAHQDDPRRRVFSDDQLARSETGSMLWDLAQTSLRVHGELHNNVRMTWGKALLPWKKSPEDALRTSIELNHRYALDGRDPASYGGLLWCFGQFDRPFSPEKAVMGTVRPRSVEAHEKRVDIERWGNHLGRAPRRRKPRVAVVGAGPAGAFCARSLTENGCEVVAFDKGRGPGGRLSTRNRTENAFDHGTAQFKLSHPTLKRFRKNWLEAGALSEWKGKRVVVRKGTIEDVESDESYIVGQPTMSGFIEYLLGGVQVEFGKRVSELSSDGIRFESGEEFECDLAILAIPAPQGVALLPDGHPAGSVLGAVRFTPCWSLMITLSSLPSSDFVEARFEGDETIAAIYRNQTKPGYSGPERWTVHATPGWSQANLEVDKAEASAHLLEALHGALPGEAITATGSSAHRWRFARVSKSVGTPALLQDNVGLCGDSLCGNGVEGALLSGAAMAGLVMYYEYQSK